ncbi:hypothetical protein KIPB_006355 [Kipferlia bialata]|uniref:Uncharacterized protein n=1 Tax=Kipferlia bialata TaxID=797122 RepID=A0A9K3GI52_9EUKA|nr:hypothetical protein KIPB_003455 [Kipferlia bialata]GIQ84794.1 hypothetical protein KIPB_006355 [Kipferlia bialata]|eukprot:g3455.t1
MHLHDHLQDHPVLEDLAPQHSNDEVRAGYLSLSQTRIERERERRQRVPPWEPLLSVVSSPPSLPPLGVA